jgi:hypothetical protein
MSDAPATLDDRQAIVELTHAYCWALDSGDWDALDRVFTPTATAELAGDLTGVEQIKARVRAALEPLDASQHMVANQQVRVDGDRATCRTYLQAQHVRRAAEGGSTYMVGGRYHDQLVRTTDGWRIERRDLTILWTDGNPAVMAR